MLKKSELSELRKKEIKDLLAMVNEKRAKITKIKTETKAGREKNLKLARNMSLEIAKILTLIREKEISAKSEI